MATDQSTRAARPRQRRLPHQPGIYAIVHAASGKRYIGSTVNLGSRLAKHREALRRGDHCCRYLQNAWNKYGEAGFSVTVIETCLNEPTILVAREQFWIDKFKGRLYNANPFAQQFAAEFWRTEQGRKLAEEHSRRMAIFWHERETGAVCVYCGKAFLTSRPEVAAYCSRKCHACHKAKTDYIETRTCEFCGGPFEISRYKSKRFCGKECIAKFLAKKRLDASPPEFIAKHCEQCGAPFEVSAKGDARLRRFCSRACIGRYSLPKVRGPMSEKSLESRRETLARNRTCEAACERCGNSFLRHPDFKKQFCSVNCKNQAAYHRRKKATSQ